MIEKEIQAYLGDLLEFLDRLLYAAFLLKREKDYENLSMRGLVITEEELDQAFELMHEREILPESVIEDLEIQEKLICMREEKAGEILPFYCLCRDFKLSSLERLALLLAAAPCFNRKYEKIYGYLQDHVDIPYPTRGLCVSLAELIGEIDAEELSGFLSGTGNLEYLLKKKDGSTKGLSSQCHLKPRIQNYLYGSMEAAESLKEKCEYFSWTTEISSMEIRQDSLDRLCCLWDCLMEEPQQKAKSCMIFLYGREGIGKRFLLRHLASERKTSFLFFDISELLYEKTETVQKILEELFVESVLLRAHICLTHADLVQEVQEDEVEIRQDKRREILAYMQEHMSCFFLLASEKEEQITDFKGRKICMELPSLSASEKIQLWHSRGAKHQLSEDVDLELNGNKYILTPKGIEDVLATAELLAGLDGKAVISQEHIRQAVRQNQQNQLGAYATLINGHFTWDDLILGEEQKRQMQMVCNQLKYREIVGEKWGFHKKTPYGRGLSVLFYGPPGTGKTMAAQVIANELGLDLYRIDISQMVSKYIGETQKNISKLFQKAKDINAVLFFDEADSLFAKRSEAKDSNDKNANSETAHLLQKLEDYEGITVLATNYLNNIDDAFKRRIKFIIHIAFPESNVRLKLWQSTLPKQTVCDEEPDFEFFAEHFELSGSNIKEILTNAAYLAASEHRGLKNCDLVEAVKLNFAKYGKILTNSDFGYLSHPSQSLAD